MLNLLGWARLLRIALAVILATAGLLAIPSPVQAVIGVKPDGGSIGFSDSENSTGEEGSDKPGKPSCVIKPGNNACYKGKSCLINDPSTLDESQVKGEMPPKPGPEYTHAFRLCGSKYEWYWTRKSQPSIEQLGWTAYGRLPFPTYRPVFNPPGFTLVNLDTWWWVDGASTETLSASAGRVSVTAEPNRMEVDPGDGTKPITCDFTTKRSDTCWYAYRRSSLNSSYTARIRLIWNVTFTHSGNRVTLPGLPTEFTSPWRSTQVKVVEIQSQVTQVR